MNIELAKSVFERFENVIELSETKIEESVTPDRFACERFRGKPQVPTTLFIIKPMYVGGRPL